MTSERQETMEMLPALHPLAERVQSIAMAWNKGDSRRDAVRTLAREVDAALRATPRAGEVTVTFSTGDSSVHLLAAAANIINGEMELMDVYNFTMQVKYRTYKRVRDALTAALSARMDAK